MRKNQTQELFDELLLRSSTLQGSPEVELNYKVEVQATVDKKIKPILHYQEGYIPPNSFTVILGPSGSGKTTLLNFLAGRLMSKNIRIKGEYQINGVGISTMDDYSNQIGYVMQQDALLAAITPRQMLTFAADLRLNLSKQLKKQHVESLIMELGLSKCADTKCGNAFIKGLSGGQKKRTAIGIQLITNPSIIFLDECTTGLDSTTALQVITLLKKLAIQGKTIVSTIHQPSSQIYNQFDRMMLLAEGHCIYHGNSDDAFKYFQKLGYPCPEMMNSAEFYLELVSYDQGEREAQKYQQKLKKLLAVEKSIPSPTLEPLPILASRQTSFAYQVMKISKRSLTCQLRNPMDVGFKCFQSIVVALLVWMVYGTIDSTDPSYYQNLRGILFFLVSSNTFSGIQGTLATFSLERPVFLRQRYSRMYSTGGYFLGRLLPNQPFELLYPSILVTIIYWATSLGQQSASEWLLLIVSSISIYFAASGFGLIYATMIERLETAMALVPVLVIPFMLLGGFFINLTGVDDIRVIFYPIMYLSPFRYGFQSQMLALDVIQQKFYPQTYQMNIVLLLVIGLFQLGVVTRVVAGVGMHVISSPKKQNLKQS